MLPKKQLFSVQKKNQIFDKPLTVVLLLTLPLSEAAVRRCSTKQLLSKILEKSQKSPVPEFLF